MYRYTFDKRDYYNDVKQFEKNLQLVNLGNIVRFSNIDLTVTHIDMLSVIHNGKYWDTLVKWYKIFEYIDYHELMFKNVGTFQKLINHLRFAISKYIQYEYAPNVYTIVYYECMKKF